MTLKKSFIDEDDDYTWDPKQEEKIEKSLAEILAVPVEKSNNKKNARHHKNGRELYND